MIVETSMCLDFACFGIIGIIHDPATTVPRGAASRWNRSPSVFILHDGDMSAFAKNVICLTYFPDPALLQ